MHATRPASEAGGDMYRLVEELYPLCRSITGNGVRATLAGIGRRIPLEITEVPSGTEVLDWSVPLEWNIRDAFVADLGGKRLIDFRDNNLHVVSYSTPIDRHMSLGELRPHLHSLPAQPELIPYRTSYYEESWGFCLKHRELEALDDDTYHVVIDSSLAPGSLSYGEFIVPGRSSAEVLISAHVCHPSLCDDNLSGIAVSVECARRLAAGPTPHHTFRFLYAPGTIGAITWLARNRDRVQYLRHGLTLTCLGDDHPFTYKRTVEGRAGIDRAAEFVLAKHASDSSVIDFFPYGYDERQYNSPGFRLPVGSLMRGRHGMFPEYHTSADDLAFVSGMRMSQSLEVLAEILEVVDNDRVFVNQSPYGEPQLGRRGLYRALGGTDIPDGQLAMLWVLNLSDGTHSLMDIAERARMPFSTIVATADILREHRLLTELTD